MSLACFRQLAKRLQTQPIVLATVVDTRGSVPREIGAKMLIWKDGCAGTIGGGAGEAHVIEQAKLVLATAKKQQIEIDLTGAPQRQTQGVCGGIMQVWLEQWNGDEAIELVQHILSHLESGSSVTLVTPFDSTRSPYLLSDSTLSAPIALPAHAFVETLQPAPTLLIVGAGHVGEQLAIVAHQIGFQIVVQDDRPDWATPQRYPQAAQIYTATLARAMDSFAAHSQLYVALVTRGYSYDVDALMVLLHRRTPCRYIGMIGSLKRVQQVYQAIEQAGISKDKLQSIYAPIGLDIGALTPAEIAVSIAAELILVQRGGTGRSLSEQHV
jgi:xanthine dehydrogenase accessory factor